MTIVSYGQYLCAYIYVVGIPLVDGLCLLQVSTAGAPFMSETLRISTACENLLYKLVA